MRQKKFSGQGLSRVRSEDGQVSYFDLWLKFDRLTVWSKKEKPTNVHGGKNEKLFLITLDLRISFGPRSITKPRLIELSFSPSRVHQSGVVGRSPGLEKEKNKFNLFDFDKLESSDKLIQGEVDDREREIVKDDLITLDPFCLPVKSGGNQMEFNLDVLIKFTFTFFRMTWFVDLVIEWTFFVLTLQLVHRWNPTLAIRQKLGQTFQFHSTEN